jgi:spore germination cell wall hydrolase CwlJ-like protein
MKLTVLVVLLLVAGATGATAKGSCDFSSQIRALALNMYHEARNQSLDGMQLVGEVTLNRVAHKDFPNTICDVVYQRYQFSWTHLLKDKTPKEKEAWQAAQLIAWELLSGKADFFNNGATHYLNPRLVKRMPRWTRKYIKLGVWEDHIFYRAEDL